MKRRVRHCPVCYRRGAGARRLPPARADGSGGPACRRKRPRRGDLLKRSHFGDGRSLPWMPLYIEPARGDAAVEKGAMCLHVASAGKAPWDVQLRHREMTIQKGHTYTVAFKAWASAADPDARQGGDVGRALSRVLRVRRDRPRSDADPGRADVRRRRRGRPDGGDGVPPRRRAGRRPSRTPSASTTCTSSIRSTCRRRRVPRRRCRPCG